MSLKLAAYQGTLHFKKPERSLEKIVELLERADREQVDILCLPEGFLGGYFKDRDDAFEHAFDLKSNGFIQMLNKLQTFSATVIVGLNEREEDDLYDTAVVIEKGQLIGRYRKAYPYHNYFKPGREFPIFEKKV